MWMNWKEKIVQNAFNLWDVVNIYVQDVLERKMKYKVNVTVKKSKYWNCGTFSLNLFTKSNTRKLTENSKKFVTTSGNTCWKSFKNRKEIHWIFCNSEILKINVRKIARIFCILESIKI